jgi:hypothetical protein
MLATVGAAQLPMNQQPLVAVLSTGEVMACLSLMHRPLLQGTR